ncbi:MAG: tyrosine-type recombinase/integrase [Sphingomonas sp.]|uniref:tyrosine-type recombinase/integrase n=1 Tax=Sphingomonas sp. TaxID=28214 RepID=UPI002609DF81|nr:tyrosine-type recombinase/integrase [Sphingomonas sp.]MDK2767839.1 tyrosine-type recombinase/integrase [Sphingomonas sp.]
MASLPIAALATSARRWPPRDTIIVDRAGLPVDVSGPVWRLNDPMRAASINWANFPLTDCIALDGIKGYHVHLIKNGSAAAVANAFHQVSLLVRMPAFQQAAASGEAIPYLALSQARDYLGKEDQWKLHYGRAMYRWCTQTGYDGFDQRVLDQIEEWRIGGNRKGAAVRSRDPNEGPLTSREVSAIVTALRAARLTGAMPLPEQAALALALAFGSNSSQFASMREDDVEPLQSGGAIAAWIVSIPRHKKGEALSRTSFRRRKLTGLYGEIIQDLIEWNGTRPTFENDARPLIRKGTLRMRTTFDDQWQAHISAATFTQLLQRAVRRLGITTYGGKPLEVTCRRFRYTLPSRMVANGASQAAVADVLDHSDLQNVPVYWEIHSDIVDQIDTAMTTALAPRAQAFAGIIRNEAEAIRGDDESSRRFLADPGSNRIEVIGNCGEFRFCGITAPYACYTCVKFQAWMNGPHREVLDQLQRARDQRESLGLHPKMVGIEDELIEAVTDTIARIAAKRASEGSIHD